MDHEDLDVYAAALDFVTFVRATMKRMPGGRASISS